MSDGAFTLALAPAVRRRLEQGPPVGLPLALAEAVSTFLTGPLLDDPCRVGRPLRRELAGHHAARRGPYRLLYRVDEGERVVCVLRVDHRSDAHRRR